MGSISSASSGPIATRTLNPLSPAGDARASGEPSPVPALRSGYRPPVQDPSAKVGRTARVQPAREIPRQEGNYGVITDFDQTLVPAHDGTPIPRPFPGIAALIHELQGARPRSSEDAGYTHYVTARTPELSAPLPAYLARQGLPSPGNLHIGLATDRDADKARKKVADISGIIARDPGRGFVLFGDSSHIDPAVYREVKARFPGQVAAALIHRVKDNVPPEGYPGLLVVDDYVDAALALHEAGVLSAQAALRVVDCARLEGLSLRAAQSHRVAALESLAR